MGCNASAPAGTNGPRKRAGGKKLVLGYWKFRGGIRGNVARYLLAYGNADWEEKNMLKPEWDTVKTNLMDFPNLPYIIDGDFKLSETYAVHQYIAQKYCPDVLGNTP